MIISRTQEKYGCTQTSLNELCRKEKVVPIYLYSDNYINRQGDVFYVTSEKGIPTLNKLEPISISKKHKFPKYKLRNDVTKKYDIKKLDELYLYTFCGPMPTKVSIIHNNIYNYEEEKKYDNYAISKLTYTISSIEKVNDDMYNVNGVLFKRIYYQGKIYTNMFISNCGVEYDHTKNIIRKCGFNHKYYPQISVGSHTALVHKVVYNTWNDCKPWNSGEFQIDHIDGYKNHNWVENLRLTTPLENFRFAAYEQNLRNTNYNYDDIRTICEMIQAGIYGPKDIAEKLNMPYDRIKHQVYDILKGKHWKDISKDYDFSKYYTEKHRNQKTDDEIIHNICKAYISGDYVHNKDIANAISVGETIVNQVLRGVYRKDISSQYPLNRQAGNRMDDTTTIKVCEEIMSGKSFSEIANKYGKTERTIRDIARRKRHPHISKKYHFEKLYPNLVYANKYENE